MYKDIEKRREYDRKRYRDRYNSDSEFREKERNRMLKYGREKKAKNRIKSLHFLGNKCSQCGYDKCSEALEAHHIGKDKIDGISNLIAKFKDWKTIKRELEKCVLLCANCHREFHANNKKLKLIK